MEGAVIVVTKDLLALRWRIEFRIKMIRLNLYCRPAIVTQVYIRLIATTTLVTEDGASQVVRHEDKVSLREHRFQKIARALPESSVNSPCWWSLSVMTSMYSWLSCIQRFILNVI